jgi:hypothetical protein
MTRPTTAPAVPTDRPSHLGARHAWERSFQRSTTKATRASAGTRRHLADREVTATTATTTTTDADHTDVVHLSKATRQPSPRTTWHPTRRLWEPR